MAEIWSEILDVERVGVEDDFFELGGHSLLTIRVVALAEERGLQLNPRQLFQAPRISKLAALLDGGP